MKPPVKRHLACLSDGGRWSYQTACGYTNDHPRGFVLTLSAVLCTDSRRDQVTCLRCRASKLFKAAVVEETLKAPPC